MYYTFNKVLLFALNGMKFYIEVAMIYATWLLGPFGSHFIVYVNCYRFMNWVVPTNKINVKL